METVKTAVIVLLLMAVLYGVYVVLNKPETASTENGADWPKDAPGELTVDFSSARPDTGLPIPPPTSPSPAAPVSSVPSTGADLAGIPSAPPFVPPSEKTDSPQLEIPPLSGAPPAPTNSAPTADNKSPAVTSPLATGDDMPKTTPDQPASPSPPAFKAESESAFPSTPPPSPAFAETPNEKPTSLPEIAPENPPTPTTPTTDSQVTAPPSSESARLAQTGPSPGDGAAADALPSARRNSFERVMQSAQSKIADGQWYEALFTLSIQYNNPDLIPEDRQKLLDVLDPLAGKVVYSSEHLIEPAYEVRRGDTLNSIAQRYNVPWQLLANVNGLTSPETLAPGTQLKVVPGPFRADVDVNGKELTLFVGRLYAGRFPITVGADPLPAAGEYRVNDKQPGRAYYGADGRTIPAEDSGNPYGQIWIDLGGDVCIHGSPRADGDARLGCISLSPADANDVFGILSKGSSVVIRR